MDQPKRTRGPQKAPTLVHINVRIPQDVLDYFKQFPSYTKKIRTVLTNYADSMK
jgi:uncharacterized protein (DUF4415 family)